jgi:hypothetical protein
MEHKGRAYHPAGKENGLVKHPERIARGENAGNVKLTDDKVVKIRTEYIPRKVPHTLLAKKFGVSLTAIQRITSRKTWTHI